MRLEIRHRTSYRYSRSVCLGRHVLRVLPRGDTGQRLLSHQVDVSPLPARSSDFVDAWGNPASALWFEGDTQLLEIDVRLDVQTARAGSPPPPGSGEKLLLPLDYRGEAAALQAYLARPAEPELMADFTADLVEQSEGRLLPLLEALNRRVHGFYGHGVRLEGAPQSPAATLQKGEGVCRDLAVLFMAACRHLGIAARFVSGYQETPASGARERRYLHAWAEVYLPRAGWRGYDQTHASPVGDRHVIVAGAADPSPTAPVEGSFSFAGEPPSSTLETELRIERRGGS